MQNRHRRLAAVVGLTALGVTLALAGSVFGVVGATGDQSPGKVSIAGDNVAFEGTNRRVTLVENITETKAIEVSVTDGQIAVTTTEIHPLTPEQRARARAIVRDNDTLRRVLEDDTELSVRPIKKIDAESTRRFDAEIETNSSSDSGTFSIRSVENVTVVNGERSVRIEPDRVTTYVEDRAVVRISRADGELVYSATVDLKTRDVVEITDHRE